ncbi:malate dehydrogenase [Candidatus Woesearchaeota archaeon]|nr:malate dehydrogenase [Candidatus Woesearchaeota archaeon]
MKKVAIIGAGNVGSTAAFVLARKPYTITLVDVVPGIAEGKALDIQQSTAVFESPAKITGSMDYTAIKDAEVVIITAGVARKPGMTREDLLKINARIIGEVCSHIKIHCPNAIVIMVTNPLDAMCHVALKALGFPKERVMGMAGVLDTARLRTCIAQHLNVAVLDVHSTVLGNHGDAMVALPEHTMVGSVPLAELTSPETIHQMIQRTKNGGAEIVALLKTGSAYYAPGAAAAVMAQAILEDSKRILPVCAYLEGTYGIQNIYVGVPVLLGRKGVEQIIKLSLGRETLQELLASAQQTASLLKSL